MESDAAQGRAPGGESDGVAGLVPLVVHQLTIRQTVLAGLQLPPSRGTALRGALLEALRRRFCVLVARGEPEGHCGGVGGCQICGLVAGEGSVGRGKEAPRPYSIQPPIGTLTRLSPGDELIWGITLFGRAERYMPYLVVALQEASTLGQGEGGKPGRVALRDVWAVNPLSGEAYRVTEGGRPDIRMPTLGIDHRQVLARAQDLKRPALTLRFRSPARLIEENRPVRRLTLETLLSRIVGRAGDLGTAYGDGPPRLAMERLLTLAAQAHVVADETRWWDVESPSSRLGRATPIGGLVGTLRLAGDFEGSSAPLLPWLIWGSLLSIGKDTTKGNGWLTIEPA